MPQRGRALQQRRPPRNPGPLQLPTPLGGARRTGSEAVRRCGAVWRGVSSIPMPPRPAKTRLALVRPFCLARCLLLTRTLPVLCVAVSSSCIAGGFTRSSVADTRCLCFVCRAAQLVPQAPGASSVRIWRCTPPIAFTTHDIDIFYNIHCLAGVELRTTSKEVFCTPVTRIGN